MSELRELYQEIILDHTKRPRNFGPLASANRRARGANPLCGDRVEVFLDLEGDVVKGVSFEGAGCALSTASASMMTEMVQGKSRAEIEHLFEAFHELVTGDPSRPGEAPPELGKLEVFSGVREFPVRVKCATLPWHTLKAALHQAATPVSTE
ncbi:MAG TPA: SUF system NifU family Fe-S cluster assembly protein [Thermoanaerobaculia bacterium]|nr:SUF system NifU family Fe-S cluster assembly protein [Thermoanaerobaculia bacterium]